jgi:hypothetical protein
MGFGEFLGAAAGGAVGFVASGFNPMGAVIGAKAGSELVGSIEEKKQLKKISKQQQALGQQQLQQGQDIAAQQQAAAQQAAQQFQPFQQAGQQALAERQALLGFGTPEQIQAAQSRVTDNPAFQFALQQGTQGVERAAAARGRLNSGRTLMQLRDLNTQLAAQAFNQRLGQLQAPIQQGFAGTQGATGALTGGAARAGQFLQQAGAQNVAAQQAAFGSQLAAGQAGRQGVSNVIDLAGTAVGAGLFDKPGAAAAIGASQGIPVNQTPAVTNRSAPGFGGGSETLPVPASLGAGSMLPPQGSRGFVGPATPIPPSVGIASPMIMGQQPGFTINRRF